MSLIKANWDPTPRQLRQFGCITFLALPLILWIWGAGGSSIAVAALVGAAVACVGVVRPRSIRPLFVALMFVTIPIGIVVSEILLALIYFGVFLPLGVMMRLVKGDHMGLTIDRNATTYWHNKQAPKGPASYYRQF